jgi:hypothetical protein
VIKQLIVTDAIVATRDTCDTNTLGEMYPSFNRTCHIVAAHPGVNAQDILNECQEIEDKIERGDINLTNSHTLPSNTPILTTTLTECADCVVVLTYVGFRKIADQFKHLKLRRERNAHLANELCLARNQRV